MCRVLSKKEKNIEVLRGVEPRLKEFVICSIA